MQAVTELRRMAKLLNRESNRIVAAVGLVDCPDYYRALGLEQARKMLERRAARLEKAAKRRRR
jgi:hypothetical protein